MNTINLPEFNSNNILTVSNIIYPAVHVMATYENITKEAFLDQGTSVEWEFDIDGVSEVLICEFNSNQLTLHRTSTRLNVESITVTPITNNGISTLAADIPVYTYITASDVTTLKDRINAEAARRNGTGAIVSRVTITPSAGSSITASDYNNLAAPIAEANSLVLNVTAGDYILASGTILADGSGSYTYLQKAVQLLESYTSKTGISTGCISSCTGLCSDGCSSTCTGTCTGNCGSACSNNCTGGCKGSCGGGCGGGCGDGCTDECQAYYC